MSTEFIASFALGELSLMKHRFQNIVEIIYLFPSLCICWFG